jgi:hypothetical protein
MRHNLPPTPAFHDALPTDRIQEIALRVVVELPGWEMHVIGTATSIAGHLAVTAKHVLDAVIRRFGAKPVSNGVEVGGVLSPPVSGPPGACLQNLECVPRMDLRK